MNGERKEKKEWNVIKSEIGESRRMNEEKEKVNLYQVIYLDNLKEVGFFPPTIIHIFQNHR